MGDLLAKIGAATLTVRAGTLSGDLGLAGVASEVSFGVISNDPIYQWAPVQLWLDGELLMTGLVDAPELGRIGVDGTLAWDLSCVDVRWLASKRTVSFAAEDETAGAAVRRMVRDKLRFEGLWTHPFPGALMTIAEFDLQGFWRLAEDETDSSRFRRHGSEDNLPTFVSSSPVNDDELGGYGDFDGAATRVVTGLESDEIDEACARGYSVSLWALHDEGTVGYAGAMGCGSSSDLSSGDIVFAFRRDSVAADSNQPMRFFYATDAGNASLTGTALTADVWEHWTATMDDVTGTARLFRDGVQVDEAVFAAGTLKTDVSGSSALALGSSAGAAHLWPGRLAEACFVSRPLTALEVATVHRAGGATMEQAIVASAPVAYWPMDDGAGSTSARELVAGANATVVDAPVFGTQGGVIGSSTAVDFVDDAEERYLDLPVSTNVSGTASSWTWAGWFWLPATDTASNPVLAAEAATSSHYLAWLMTLDVSPQTSLRLYGKTADGTVFSGPNFASLDRERWHHLASVYDAGADTMTLYVNGVAGTPDSVPFPSVTGPMTEGSIGSLLRAGSAGARFGGYGQHFAKWNRAVTADELAEQHAKGADYYATDNPRRPATRVADGPTLGELVVAYQRVDLALDELAAATGYDWHVDRWRTVHFHLRTATCCQAPWDVTETATYLDGPGWGATSSRTNPKYRNQQVITGIKDETDSQVELFKGDGLLQTFVAAFPVARVPTVEVDLGAGFVAQTVGIRGVEQSKDWYWNKGSHEISQDADGTKLVSTDQLRLTYIGEFSMVVVAGTGSEQQRLRDLGDVSGVVEHVATGESVNRRQDGIARATGKLQTFSLEGRRLSFSTMRPGLSAGQWAKVHIPTFDLNNAEMLVSSVRLQDQGTRLVYDVEAIIGPLGGGWEELFLELGAKRERIERVNLGEVTLLTVLVSDLTVDELSETWAWTPDVTVTPNVCDVLDAEFPVEMC